MTRVLRYQALKRIADLYADDPAFRLRVDDDERRVHLRMAFFDSEAVVKLVRSLAQEGIDVGYIDKRRRLHQTMLRPYALTIELAGVLYRCAVARLPHRRRTGEWIVGPKVGVSLEPLGLHESLPQPGP